METNNFAPALARTPNPGLAPTLGGLRGHYGFLVRVVPVANMGAVLAPIRMGLCPTCCCLRHVDDLGPYGDCRGCEGAIPAVPMVGAWLLNS